MQCIFLISDYFVFSPSPPPSLKAKATAGSLAMRQIPGVLLSLLLSMCNVGVNVDVVIVTVTVAISAAVAVFAVVTIAATIIPTAAPFS
jgi:hypothetical protein